MLRRLLHLSAVCLFVTTLDGFVVHHPAAVVFTRAGAEPRPDSGDVDTLRLTLEKFEVDEWRSYMGHEYLRLLALRNDVAYLGGNGALYKLSTSTWRVPASVVVKWNVSETTTAECKSVNYGASNCNDNFIRTFLPLHDGKTILICGSRGRKPACRNYTTTNTNELGHLNTNTTLYPEYLSPHQGESLFTTVSDGDVVYPAIYTTDTERTSRHSPFVAILNFTSNEAPLQTRSQELLKNTKFLQSWAVGKRIYYFFTERDIAETQRFPRVAQICKNDRGTMQILSSFFKLDVRCSSQADNKEFAYEDMVAVSKPFSRGNESYFYATFSTPPSQPGSLGICEFKVSDLAAGFRDAGGLQAGTKYGDDVLHWNPSDCDRIEEKNDEHNSALGRLRYTRTGHVSRVKMSGDKAVLVDTMTRWEVTQMTVAPGVLGTDGKRGDVIWLGTRNGTLVKLRYEPATGETIVVEEIQVFGPEEAVVDLRLTPSRHILVLSKSAAVRLPLARCSKFTDCRMCQKIQDPYCSWSGTACQLEVGPEPAPVHRKCAKPTLPTKVDPTPAKATSGIKVTSGSIEKPSGLPEHSVITELSSSREAPELGAIGSTTSPVTQAASGLSLTIVITLIVIAVLVGLAVGGAACFVYQRRRRYGDGSSDASDVEFADHFTAAYGKTRTISSSGCKTPSPPPDYTMAAATGRPSASPTVDLTTPQKAKKVYL